MAEGKI